MWLIRGPEIYIAMFVYFYSLRPCQQSFSYVGTGLSGLNHGTKQGLMRLAQGHNVVRLVRLKPWPFCLESSILQCDYSDIGPEI